MFDKLLRYGITSALDDLWYSKSMAHKQSHSRRHHSSDVTHIRQLYDVLGGNVFTALSISKQWQEPLLLAGTLTLDAEKEQRLQTMLACYEALLYEGIACDKDIHDYMLNTQLKRGDIIVQTAWQEEDVTTPLALMHAHQLRAYVEAIQSVMLDSSTLDELRDGLPEVRRINQEKMDFLLEREEERGQQKKREYKRRVSPPGHPYESEQTEIELGLEEVEPRE